MAKIEIPMEKSETMSFVVGGRGFGKSLAQHENIQNEIKQGKNVMYFNKQILWQKNRERKDGVE